MNILLKRTYLILILSIGFNSCINSVKNNEYILLEEKLNGEYHTIFIDTSKNSKYYDQIANFSFNNFDQESYNKTLEYFKAHDLKLNKINIDSLPREWVALKRYKGKYYTYRPSDFIYHQKMKITDSTVIEYIEGAISNKIISYELKNNKVFDLRLTGIHKIKRELIIQIIDKENGIAVFIDSENNKDKEYYLMIAADKIKNFPIIVNLCETGKQDKFEKFDSIDFKQLINR